MNIYLGNKTSIVNDTIFFNEPTKKATLNIKTWVNGETYVFEKGTTSLKAKVAAGSMLKARETSLAVNYKHALKLTWEHRGVL